MNYKSRLEIYPSKDVKDSAVIVGERQALKELAYALLRASTDAAGFHSLNLYKGNGHNYEIFVTRNIEESEWQDMPKNAKDITFIRDYEELRTNLIKKDNVKNELG